MPNTLPHIHAPPLGLVGGDAAVCHCHDRVVAELPSRPRNHGVQLVGRLVIPPELRNLAEVSDLGRNVVEPSDRELGADPGQTRDAQLPRPPEPVWSADAATVYRTHRS